MGALPACGRRDQPIDGLLPRRIASRTTGGDPGALECGGKEPLAAKTELLDADELTLSTRCLWLC